MRASGSSSCSFSRRCLDRLDLVVQEVDLAAALELAQHRLADRAAALVAHEGLDRQAPLRRGGDHGQVAQAFERHAERARDRRRGERQHVDLGAHRLDRLLVAHAEAVLLVDDQQAQALELHVLAEQLVRADDDVDRAVGEAFERGLDLLAASESATARPPSPATCRSGRRCSGSAARPAAWSARGSPPACRRCTATKAARSATSVLPKPTSPQTRRSIGLRRLTMSWITAWIAALLVGRLLEAEARGEGLVVVRREAERDSLRARRGARTGSAARPRCRAPARRPCAWPCPTGREPSLCSGASSALTPV